MRRRSLAALPPFLWLATRPARAAGCALDQRAALPLRDIEGFLAITAGIEGAAYSLLLDTGADAGLIAPAVVNALRIAMPPTARAQITGTGGGRQAAFPIAIVETLVLGRLALRNIAVPVGNLPAMPIMSPPVAGLLGGDLLRHFEVEIDVPGGALRLYASDGRRGPCAGVPPWSGAFSTIPIAMRGNRVTLPVLLNGTPITALLDSGARSRIVSRRVALASGVLASALDAEPGGITSGVDMHDEIYHWHRFRSLAIGDEIVRGPVLTVAPLADAADMLLGSDWFASHRVWISYATGHLFVQPRPQAQVRQP